MLKYISNKFLIAGISLSIALVLGIGAYSSFYVSSVSSIAALQNLGPASPQYSTMVVTGIQGAGDTFQWVSGSLPCDATTGGGDGGTTFCANNGSGGYLTTGYWLRQNVTNVFKPEWFGAHGTAFRSLTGVANATTTFTDTNADCGTLSAEGFSHILIIPIIGTSDSQVNTTFTCDGTDFQLADAPSWSGTSVRYYVGYDDGPALVAAISAVNAARDNYVVAKLLLQGKIYLATSAVSSGLGQITGGITGNAGSSTIIAIGGLTGSNPGIELVPYSTAEYKNFTIDAAYSGGAGIQISSSPYGMFMENVGVLNAQTDCWLFASGTGQGIEHSTFTKLYAERCGLNGIDVDNSSGYFTISTLSNINVRGISMRADGGTCIAFTDPGFQVASLTFDNVECDAEYGSSYQTTYKPLNNAIYFSTGSWRVAFNNLGVENTDASSVCTENCETIGMDFESANVFMWVCTISANAHWASYSHQGCYSAAGILPGLASSGSETIMQTPAFTSDQTIGTVVFNNADSSGNSSTSLWNFIGSYGTPSFTQTGVDSVTGTGKTVTPTGTAPAGAPTVSVTNSSGDSNMHYVYTGVGFSKFLTN